MVKKSIKILSLITAASIMATSIIGCGRKAEDESSKGSDKTTLTIYHIWAGGDSKADIMTKVLDEFQKENQDIKLDIQTDSTEAFQNKIKTYAASGSMPDVCFAFTYSQLAPIAKSGNIADLTEAINKDKEWKDSFREGALDAMSFDGKVYGIPMEANAEGIFYNKALFDKVGIDFPKTYDELKEAVKKFKAAGIIPIALAGKETFPSFHFGQYFLERQAGYGKLKDIINKKDKFNNVDFIEGFNKYSELVKLGAFPDNIGAVSYDQSRQLFIQGKAAMINDGTWDIPQYDAEGKEDFGKNIEFASLPAFTDGKGTPDSVCKNVANGFVIKKDLEGAKKEAAIKLLKYLSTGKGAKMFADEKVILASKVQGDNAKLGSLLPKVLKTMEETKSFGQYDNELPGSIGPKLYETCQEVIVGGKPSEVLSKLDSIAQDELK